MVLPLVPLPLTPPQSSDTLVDLIFPIGAHPPLKPIRYRPRIPCYIPDLAFRDRPPRYRRVVLIQISLLVL
jgi:hypothetical protein